MRFDHIIEGNAKYLKWADDTALLIKQHESDIMRLRKLEVVLRAAADTEPRADDPIFDVGNLPLGLGHTVGAQGAIKINPRQPMTVGKSADEIERELARVVAGERVPA